MIARGVTREQLEQAAAEVGVRFAQGTPEERETRKGPEHRFTLKTDTERFGYPDKQGNGGAPWRRKAYYPRENGRYATVPGSVCWGGHRAFFRALYGLAPTAWIKTAKAIYTSAGQFEATHRATQKIGHTSGWDGDGSAAQWRPLSYEEACFCGDHGD